MKILILTQYFYPDIASTGQLLSELSVELSKMGIGVNVITGFPSYSYKIPSSKRENYQSVEITRLWSTRMNKNKLLGQIFNAITFFSNSFFHLLSSKDNTPLLIVSNPPFLPFIGYLLKVLKKRRYIFLVHDVFPEKASKLNYLSSGNFLYKIWKKIDKRVMNTAEYIVVLSDSMKKVLKEKFEREQVRENEKIIVINNWADGNFISPSEESGLTFRKEHNIENKFIVQYSGNLGASYDLEKIIDCAKITEDEEVLYMFIGDGVKKSGLEQLCKSLKLKNVLFIPYLDKSRLPFSLNCADVSILTYEEHLEGLLMPSKLYTIMASGKPIIALCNPESEVSKILCSAKCGYTVYNNIEEFKEKIRLLKSDSKLRKEMGKNARRYFEENFNIGSSIGKYRQLIEKINQ